jgi:hypothetical protein
MKNHSVESLPTSVATRLTGNRISAMLRDLNPRFFEGLTMPELKSILAAAEYRKLSANSVITHQDQPAKHLFLLLTGRPDISL